MTTEYPDYRKKLKCSFEQIDDCFDDYMKDVLRRLSSEAVADYLKGASMVCMIGRGFEPVLVYLEEMPDMAHNLGEDMLKMVSQAVWDMSRTPNGNSIPPFMQCLPEAARRLGSSAQMNNFIEIIFEMMHATTGSIHGHHTTFPSPGLPDLLKQMPYLLSQLSLEGLKNWMQYGVRNYNDHPERQRDYFTLQSADAKAMLQRERHGTLYMDHERQINYYLRSMWQLEEYVVPYSLGFDELRKPQPYYDQLGMRVPDVFDELNAVSGMNRYRIVLAHMAAHKRWSTRQIADNLSPFQRIAVEVFEDSRIETLMLRDYPGLKKYLLALHPIPIEGSCDNETQSCVRHRLTMLSRAILDENHSYQHTVIIEFVEKFHNALKDGALSDTKAMLMLAISFTAKTRKQSDQLPKVHFDNTEIDYRDDNRHLWVFIEEDDEPEDIQAKPQTNDEHIPDGLPPRHYQEWDYNSSSYKPDWVTLYESLHPPGNASDIDKILEKHSALANYLKRILDLLKPQNYVRVRYQEEGSELDLDVAIRSLIDFKSGTQPDTRINMSHEHNGRDFAVLLLMDLSASLHETPQGCTQSILELSREAVTLLGWSIEQLGDKFAIAGFHSDTRHNVRYHHLKGFSEHWNDEVKARLAAIEAGYSTRMGAAIRHASHYLEGQQADKKLLLILTDGEPADIDVSDEKLLINDTHKAVDELSSKGIYTHCISLDQKADEYIADIFGSNGYTVIDNIEKLPEKLPKLFMSLTA
ncbi:Rubisco activation protein CbbO [hydrothermal vent metagenome]|uniref:Rubisco activation protein CbbO n=1 Tax=hydrothermal vent metagenome TaxID=652676 RepID=A0A3B1ALH5_9ZZZZ